MSDNLNLFRINCFDINFLEKLTIFVDKQELDKAQEMAQVLRITHNVDVQAVSLQCCSLVLSRRCVCVTNLYFFAMCVTCMIFRRCAVIRKTVYDVTNHTKQEELRILVKKAVQYYSKIIILVEKNKGNKGLEFNLIITSKCDAILGRGSEYQ